MNRKIAFLILSSTLIASLAVSPVLPLELPVLKTVIIEAKVDLSSESGIYAYNYTLTNPSTNIGEIWVFDIDISKPSGGLELSKEGLVNKGDYAENTSKAISEQTIPGITTVPMIPVGMQSPPNWGGGLSVFGTAGWGNDEDLSFLPGLTQSDFIITSHGLPGIRAFKVKPYLDVDLLASSGLLIIPTNSEELERYKKDLAVLKDSVSVKGKTIGPTAPPANFVAVDFLSYLIDLKHQAEALDWIGGTKFVADLDKKLDQTKEKLLKNNIESARGKLKSFINKIEAQFKETKEDEVEKIKEDKKGKGHDDKKFVTSEGYGLLKFNAKYLIDQLGQGEPKEDED